MENYGKLLLQILSAPNCLGQFSKWMSPRIYIKETNWVRKEGIQKSRMAVGIKRFGLSKQILPTSPPRSDQSPWRLWLWLKVSSKIDQ